MVRVEVDGADDAPEHYAILSLVHFVLNDSKTKRERHTHLCPSRDFRVLLNARVVKSRLGCEISKKRIVRSKPA